MIVARFTLATATVPATALARSASRQPIGQTQLLTPVGGRVFNISAPFTVMLSGLTITHGKATNGNGGGIFTIGGGGMSG